jgi:hypothetical protein
LYSTSKDPGAFAAGKTFKERVYYRGGSSAGLLKALTDVMTTADDLTIEPVSINRKIGRAKELEIKVTKPSGGFYDTVGLTDTGEIEKLGDVIDANETLRIREDDDISSTVAADIDLIRRGTKVASFRLRGNRLQFGSNFQYEVELKTDAFYRQLRKLAGDPVED